MHLTLLRHAYLPHVTLGRLYAADLILPTLEEGWSPDPDGPGGQRREAGKTESCIPDGAYRVVPHTRPTGQRVWALVNAELGVYRARADIPRGQRWGRCLVLIHSGNTTFDIEGCVLVGTVFGKLNGKEAVLSSQAALAKLAAVLGHDDEHTITIGPTPGTTERGIP